MNDVLVVRLPGGAFEYRFRCGNCHWSGPWPAFFTAHRNHDAETMYVCERCYADADIFLSLQLDDWAFV